MEKNEIICISSDDDGDAKQNKIDNKQSSINRQLEGNYGHDVKVELLNTSEKVKTCGQKRKVSELTSDSDSDVGKSAKVFVCEDDKDKECSREESSDKFTIIQKKEKDKTLLKPQLVIKERKTISPVEQDIFPMFISLCFQKDRSEDMKIIVNKLKRRYEQLDPTYANSEAFINFLNEKRNDIMYSKNKLYIHIAEVMNEMKNRCKGRSTLLLNDNNCTSNRKKTHTNNNSSITNASRSNRSVINNSVVTESEVMLTTDDEKDQEKYDATQRKITIILKAMKKCEKYIKKLEKSETNFDDENNSNYIKLERYKHRMVELYNLYCEYSGESVDAGRQYLRPKHFNITGIVSLDQAITSFINSKISKRKKLKKIGAFTDALIFPDYRDIVECVTKCNETQNLGLDNKKQQQIAKKAFIELGEHLQCSRRNDYWDTFSLFVENQEEDPALKDPELAKKLTQNKIEGEKRLTNVFQTYVKKQEEMKDLPIDSETSSENEEDSIENEDEDNNNEEDNISEDDASLNSNKDKYSLDEDETSIDDEIPKNNSDIDIKSTVEEIDSNIIETEEKRQVEANDRLMDDDNLKSTKVDDVINMPKCKDAELIKRNETTPSSNDVSLDLNISPNVSLSTTLDNKISIDSTKERESDIISEEPMNKQPLEEKPLLRVRSFAKPPMTWKDVQEKVDHSNVDENTSKTLIDNDVIDLTQELPKKNSTVRQHATIQIGSKVLPIIPGKCKKLVIPAGKSIITVKNITNNYMRLNSKDMDSSNATQLQYDQTVTSSYQVIHKNGGSTTICITPNQLNQQTNIDNQAKNLQTKENNTAREVPRSNQIILPPTRQKENIIVSKTNSSMSQSK